jgi:hypothetical protein
MLYRAALALAILMLAATMPTFAETVEEQLACTPDVQILCADEIPDRDEIYACLVKKVNDLSPACKSIISASIPPAPVSATATKTKK